MSELLQQSRETWNKLMEHMTKVEETEKSIEAVQLGAVSILTPEGELLEIPIEPHQIARVKDVIIDSLREVMSVSVNYLNVMNSKQAAVLNPSFDKEFKEMVSKAEKYDKMSANIPHEAEFDAELVRAELKAGKTLRAIHLEHYPERDASWIYKRCKKAGIDYKQLMNEAAMKKEVHAVLEDHVPDYDDDWVDMGVDEPEPDPIDTWRSASTQKGKAKAQPARKSGKTRMGQAR